MPKEEDSNHQFCDSTHRFHHKRKKSLFLMIMNRLFLFLGIILFISCSDLKKGEQLQSLDQLSATVDSIEVVLIEHHIDTLKQMLDNAKEVQESIAQFHSSDTIPLEFALRMDEYKLMIQNIPEIEQNQLTLKNSIAEIRASLSNLKVDISNASGEKQKYDEFIAHEKKKVNELREVLTNYDSLRNQLMEHFNELHEEMKEFALSNNQ